MKKLLIFLFHIFNVLAVFGQGVIDEQQTVFFRNEKTFAVSLHSDGYGIGYRGAKRINYLNKNLYEIDFGTFKNPKEYKVQSYYVNASYVFGKINTATYLRGGVGKQHEIFKKADLGGIAVRYFYTGGISLSLYKPIYYKIANIYMPTGSDVYYLEITEDKFETAVQSPEDIYSKASFFKGISETKVLPGLYAKGGLNFEYSIEDKSIHAIEIGCQVNGYPKKIPIMAGDNNKAIFFSLFVSYRIGVIVDPLSKEKTSIFNFLSKKRVNEATL